jgi:hypothetical protein
LVMAQRPYRLLGLPETRSLIFLIKNSPDQVEGYLDYLQPAWDSNHNQCDESLLRAIKKFTRTKATLPSSISS